MKNKPFLIMKNLCLFLFSFFLVTASFAQNHPAIKPDSTKSPEAILADVKAKKAYLVDVRTLDEFQTGHLKFSKNIDFKAADFQNQITKLKKRRPVYLYCRSGNRSSKAADSLRIWGFKTVYNLGALTDLQKVGLPSE
jgi:phage shock protein E